MQSHNYQHILLAKQVVIFTALPFLLNTGLYCVEILVQFGLGLNLNARLFDPLSNFGQEETLASQARHFLTEIYQSYVYFMMAMLILIILRMMVDYVKSPSTYETKSPQTKKQYASNGLAKLCKLAVYFTLSYCFCNLLLKGDIKESSMIKTRNLASTPFSQVNENPIPTPDVNLVRLSVKPLSTNKDFLTSVPIGSKMMVIANNGKDVFTIFKEWRPFEPALAHLDLSNLLQILYPQNGFWLVRFGAPYRHTSLAISPNDQKLIVVDCGMFAIFDLVNPPAILSEKYTDSKICDDKRLKLYQPSISISADSKIAMISVGGLFIWDISKADSVTELFADQTIFTTAVVLCSMKKIALVGGYGLIIFDVSNFSSPKLLSILYADCLIASIAVSSDEKTAVVATFPLDSPGTLILRVLDLASASTKGSLEIQHSDQYCHIDSDFPPVVTITPNNDYIFWSCGKTYGNIYFATLQVKDTFLDSHPINSMTISKDGKYLLTTTDLQISIYKMGLSVEPSKALIWKPQQPSSTFAFSNVSRILTSDDGKTIYVCYQEMNSFYIRIMDITNATQPVFQGIIKLPYDPIFMTLSASQNFLYILLESSRIIIVDVSTKNKPTTLLRYRFTDYEFHNQFAVTPDDKRIYATNVVQDKIQFLFFIDLSDDKKEAVTRGFTFGFEQPPVAPFLTISSDGQTLFYMRSHLLRFNISNHRDPIIIDSFYPKNAFSTAPIVFSPDNNFAFMLCMPSEKFLDIYNISDGWEKYSTNGSARFELPSSAESLNYFKNSEMVFTKTAQGYLTINVSNASNPTFATFIKRDAFWKVTAVTQNTFLAASQSALRIFSLEQQYALSASSDNFQLGVSSSLKLQILKLNILKKYDEIESNHKFIKLNLYKAKESVPKFDPLLSDLPLPNWMYFDSSKNEITIEPKLLSHVNSYQLYTVVSLQIEKDVFSDYFLGDQWLQSLVMRELMEREYIDKDMFLTSKFYLADSLFLSSKFEEKENEFRDILRDYIIEQGISLSVASSLFLRQNNNENGFLSIETPSKQPIIVEVELKAGQAKFPKRQYSVQKTSFNQLQTKITLEGPLLNINEALKELLINVNESQALVEATIMIQDSLNAPVLVEMKNATKFFKLNQKPRQNSNHTIQEQIEKFSFVSGQSFSINLNPETFYDVNDEPLHYSLSGEPDWIILNGLSLGGTPPKTFFASKVNLMIVAQNEFKKESIQFTVTYTASFGIIISQIAIYCGYIFSLYKFWLHHAKFFNILGKRFYQDPKEYQVEICQEVTDAILPPIRFIAKEMKIIRVILTELREYLKQDKQLMSSSFSNSSGIIQKQKLIQAIQEMIKTSLSYENKRRLYSYSRGTKDFQDLINELVANEILLERLQLSEEKLSQKAFNQIKSRWNDFVRYDGSILGFSVNRNYLEEEICSSKYDESSSAPLINSGVNFELLEIAIKVHAYKTHNLKKKQAGVHICSKEKKIGFSLWYGIKKFLKLHLVDLKSEIQDELGYGLKYSLGNNELRFGGIVAANMFDTTVVVQLVNKKGLILREIEIYGVENLAAKENEMELPL